MIPVQFKKRAGRKNFRPNDDQWNLDLIFQLEKNCIDSELMTIAGNKWNDSGLDGALAHTDTLMSDLRDNYTTSAQPLTSIWNKAIHKRLQTECPSNGKILGFKIAFWIALLAEVVVMGVQAALSGDINPFIFVLAIILGLGGYLQGLGIGNLLFVRWKNHTERPHEAPVTRDWILVAIGSVLILLVSAVRGASGIDIMQFLLVFLVTLFFGETVAICEASAVDLSQQRNECHTDMESCQQFQASQNHKKNLSDGTYRRDYQNLVGQVDKSKLQRNPTVGNNVSAEPV